MFDAIYVQNLNISMKKILFRKLLSDCTLFFLISLFSTSIIIWVFQAVNFLDIIVEDGRNYLVYLNFSLLNFPKIVTKLIPFILFFSLNSFSNNNSQFVEFKNISFDEFKLQNNFQFQLNAIFNKPDKKSLLPSGPLNDLINKFANTNYLSLKIKSSREKQNELKISFSKSSLAIKYMLD